LLLLNKKSIREIRGVLTNKRNNLNSNIRAKFKKKPALADVNLSNLREVQKAVSLLKSWLAPDEGTPSPEAFEKWKTLSANVFPIAMKEQLATNRSLRADAFSYIYCMLLFELHYKGGDTPMSLCCLCITLLYDSLFH
jgi:hypothetical protein